MQQAAVFAAVLGARLSPSVRQNTLNSTYEVVISEVAVKLLALFQTTTTLR